MTTVRDLAVKVGVSVREIRAALALLSDGGLVRGMAGRRARVRIHVPRQVVNLLPRDEVTARLPTWEERETLSGGCGGVAMIEVHRAHGGQVDVYRSDQVTLRAWQR